MINDDKYEISKINSEAVFEYNEKTKTFKLLIKGKTKTDDLLLKMNRQGSATHGVSIKPIFSAINRINKVLSFEKIDFEDFKKYKYD